MSENNSPSSDAREREQKRSLEAPYSEPLKAAVERIKDQPFLFVIAIAIVLAGILAVASGIGTTELRLAIQVVAILAGSVIIGYYLQDALRSLQKRNSPSVSAWPLQNMRFDDEKINHVVSDLGRRHQAEGSNALPVPDLIKLLSTLFDRRTFCADEPLFTCTTQDWTSRLHITFQTIRVYEAYEFNVEEYGGSTDQIRLYRQLLDKVKKYSENMATYLFNPIVVESEVQKYIGTPEFVPHVKKAQLHFTVQGGVLTNMDHSWDTPRKDACDLMDALRLTVN